MDAVKHFVRVSRGISAIYRRVTRKRCSYSSRIATKTAVVGTVAASGILKLKNNVKLEKPDPSTFSTEYLIKSSTVVTVEHASSLLTYTAIAMEQAEKKYAEALFTLIVLTEYRLNVLGHTEEEARISDLILEARTLLDKEKAKKQDLEIMMMTARTLVNAAAEMALMAGADTSASIGGDRLNKVDQLLRSAHAESQKAELKFRETEAKTIATETELAEQMEEEKIARAAILDSDANQSAAHTAELKTDVSSDET